MAAGATPRSRSRCCCSPSPTSSPRGAAGRDGRRRPAERFEPDVGPDDDLDPLRAGLENLFEGIDDYIEVDDPVLGGEPVQSSLSGDLVLIAGALVQGQRHYAAGQVIEALWWWQYSYLANWGERASSALRVLQTVLAHLRLDVDDESPPRQSSRRCTSRTEPAR